MLSHRVVNGLAALNNLLPSISHWKKNQPRMGEGMIADHVPAPRNFPRNIRPLLYEASNQKERSLNVVLVQDIQQPQCMRIIRPIVKREGHAPAARRSTEGPPKPLPSRSHGLISQRNSGPGRCSSADSESKHGGIVNAPEVRNQKSECRSEKTHSMPSAQPGSFCILTSYFCLCLL